MKMHMSQKSLSWFRWVGTFCGVMGAILVASNSELSKYAFPVFLLSAVLWAVVALELKDRALLMLQIAFMCVDIFGIYRWFF